MIQWRKTYKIHNQFKTIFYLIKLFKAFFIEEFLNVPQISSIILVKCIYDALHQLSLEESRS